jgi:hypothetical protein
LGAHVSTSSWVIVVSTWTERVEEDGALGEEDGKEDCTEALASFCPKPRAKLTEGVVGQRAEILKKDRCNKPLSKIVTSFSKD